MPKNGLKYVNKKTNLSLMMVYDKKKLYSFASCKE